MPEAATARPKPGARAVSVPVVLGHLLPCRDAIIAIAMLVVSGWLGGKMVYVHGVAVEKPPEPAPSTKRPLGT